MVACVRDIHEEYRPTFLQTFMAAYTDEMKLIALLHGILAQILSHG